MPTTAIKAKFRLSDAGHFAKDDATKSDDTGSIVNVSEHRSNVRDDLSRLTYGILGIPIDAVEIGTVIRNIQNASAEGCRYLISTPNLNFLISSMADHEFRRSLLVSDLCPVDGVPVVWIARLLRAPIQQRVAGSDIFEALKMQRDLPRPSKVFLFGGPSGVAEAASRALNASAGGLACVGALYPGYCSVEDMSTQKIINEINTSGADFLIVSLGAKKGQAWLLHNQSRLHVPVRSHLGAAINFQGGTLKRAPMLVRKLGLEWLWRIKEEPYLWRRYWRDGSVLLTLLLKHVLPLMMLAARRRFMPADNHSFAIKACDSDIGTTIRIAGAATESSVEEAVAVVRSAVAKRDQILIDLSAMTYIDSRFFGLLLMIWKQQNDHGSSLRFTGVGPKIEKLFRLNRFEFLLDGRI